MIALGPTTSASSTNSNSVTTSGIDTSGMSFLCVAVADYNGVAVGTLSDSKGNTWTALTTYTGTYSRMVLYYVNSNTPTVGTGHTFTYTRTGSFPAICVISASGTAAAPFDVQNGASAPFTSAGPLATGSVTPTYHNSLIISGNCNDSPAQTHSINSSFTITNQQLWGSGTNDGCAMAYKIQTTATAENPQWSWPSATGVSVAIAVFKEAANRRRRALICGAAA